MPPNAAPASSSLVPLHRHRGARLYLAEGELVEVEVITMRELYLRYAYRDIQAIEVSRTGRGANFNWVFGVVASLCLAGALLSRGEVVGLSVFVAGALVLAVLLAVNVARGPTCRCTVKTATGQHTLWALVRLRPTLRAVERIAERVEAVQGVLDRATAARQMDGFLARRAPRPA